MNQKLSNTPFTGNNAKYLQFIKNYKISKGS